MSEQISLRLSPKLLTDAKRHAQKKGYRSVQALIEESLREKLYEDELTPREVKLIDEFFRLTKGMDDIYATEEEGWAALRKASGHDRNPSGK